MKHHRCFAMWLIAAILVPVPPNVQSAFAQGRGGRSSQERPQKGSYRQGPAPIFHTDVPERLLDVTLARPTDRSVTVVVTSYEDLETSVEYGTTPGDYFASTPPKKCNRGDTQHLLLSSLKPNTRYYYRVRYQIQGTPWVEASPEYTFHTQRPPREPFCFTVQADSHLDGPTDGVSILKH